MRRILLMGNPNVGKSVVFSRLTGVKVISSNYPGTTVEYVRGYLKLGDERVEIIDVPGSYTLEPTSKAEEVAVRMLEEGDIIVSIVDATNLERNLYLTLELLELGKPVVVVLNIWDETRHRGIEIDVTRLERLLGVPVVPTVGTTGEGIKELVQRLLEAKPVDRPKLSREERYARIGRIVSEAQTLYHHHHTPLERLQDLSVNPVSGLIIAALILFASFWVVRLIGEGLIKYIFDPFFEGVYAPLLMGLSGALGGSGFLHEILVGTLIDGGIDFGQSFGLLTTGIYVPFAAVLPYVFSFYLVISFLEDVGYLPRLAVLTDTLMHRLGLHGFAIIPNLLGLGCNVPAVMAARVLESQRERFIASTLVSIAVPCAALQAMVIGLVGQRGIQYVLMVYGTLLIVWLVLGFILNQTVPGFSPELIVEIPPFRLPPPLPFLDKLRTRMLGFLREAVPMVLGGVFVIGIFYTLGVFDFIARITAPVVSTLWGLPREAVGAIAIGFLRKDLAVGMLAPLNLTNGQLVTGCVVLAMFFPCIATFVVLFKELGLRRLLLAVLVMLIASLAVGTALNLIL
jgi:ferrous iron transport protein B